VQFGFPIPDTRDRLLYKNVSGDRPLWSTDFEQLLLVKRVLSNGGLLEGHLGACQHAVVEFMIAVGNVGSWQP
jgi:hypothetical protein